MQEEKRKVIWQAVDGTNFSGTYWERYHLIKSLNFGHRPTKSETDEVLFYAVSKLLES